jgi:hypothetical protein
MQLGNTTANQACLWVSYQFDATAWLVVENRDESGRLSAQQRKTAVLGTFVFLRHFHWCCTSACLADLLNLDVDLVFYDTTSLHFEIDEVDAGPSRGNEDAGKKSYPALRRRGHAKNGREDAPQIVIGLAVTRDGFPVRHWVFPGNTVDVTTVARVKADLQGWRLNRCLFVGDAGMVSEANLQALSRGGGRYILCMPIQPGGEVAEAVLKRPGRYREVAQNLRVKEVVVGDGERRRRYVVCFNPQEAARQGRHRAELIQALEAELESLRQTPGEPQTKRLCQLRSSRRYDPYLRLTKQGLPAIDRTAVKTRAKLDGKFVVHSNDDTLTAEEMALGYASSTSALGTHSQRPMPRGRPTAFTPLGGRVR